MEIERDSLSADAGSPRLMRLRFLILFLLCVSGLCVWALVAVRTYERPSGLLRVAFLDVGQGDAIYKESPTGREVLIDGGPDRSVLRQLTKQMGFFDRSLDTILLTHEDKDHVGGFPDVFTRYRIARVIRTEQQGESGAASLVDVRQREEGSEITYARRGMRFDLGGGAELEILFPDRDPRDLESNTASIVARLTYGATTFLFTGDSPDEIEQYLVSLGCDALKSDALKAGHHGSRTSTSEEFLSCVDPSEVVISAGKDNRYGHPHREVVDRIAAFGSEMLNTADEGPIVFQSDGTSLSRVR